ncbi:methyltransferase [Streptomyces mashuensis]|uniref:Methyltransferase n=1 Tax=Streptomyces mashuensis TaxID=33904 RepID=A0A919ED94_9ACTN|nr:class I SAM-dependent methyltransferase [Streptomyces mashuensis]GHF46897.1 methyltransferase [Streptomyces mashuensis]
MTRPVTRQLRATADAYDAVATRYAALFRDSLAGSPVDRATIAAFADSVRDAGAAGAAGAGPVADLGCGPGHLTAHLRDLGLDAFGVDLSPAMIDLAREAYPDLRFDVGDMTALPLPDGSLSGILAWYSFIHATPDDVPSYVAECARLLAPGGHLLLGFFAPETGHPVTPFDHKVTTAYRWPVDDLAAMATTVGLEEVARTLRQPAEGERFGQGRLLLRRR